MKVIDEAELLRLLPIPDAVDALERAFRGPRRGDPQRIRIELPAGDLLLMPSADAAHAGVKLVTIAPGNAERGRPVVQATYVLFHAETLTPTTLIDGTALTTLRTASVSALAARYLAGEDARRLVIFGAGTQADAHLAAMAAVRPTEEVTIVSRTPDRPRALVKRAEARGLGAPVGYSTAVARGDIVCTCTTSVEPVLDGSLLPPGSHVNAIGAYRPQDRELDDEAIRRARVVVEDREAVLAEAGDLLIPIAAGVVDETHIVADLAEVVRGAKVRRTPADVTVFKSVGIAFEDLAVAAAAVERGTGG